MRAGPACCLSVIVVLSPHVANAQDFRAGDFRAHRAAAVKAVNAGDFATAESEISSARAMLPSAPSVLLLGAQIEVAAGKPDAAKPWLDDYIRRGLWFSPERYPKLAELLDEAGRARLATNGSDFGGFATLGKIEDLRLIEGVAVDGNHVYLSSVHKGGLNVLNDATLRVVTALPSGLGGYGLAVKGGKAWMAVSPGAVSGQAAEPQHAGVLQIDLKSGAVTQRFDADTADHSFGDLTLGKKDLYASDGKSGELLRLKGKAAPWQTLIPAGRLGSAQGLAENADGSAVIVADYTSGLYRIDVTTGAVRQLAVPDTASLVGIDGVARFGDDLIVVQNGIQPTRILNIHMNRSWDTIEAIDILARGGNLDEPTGGQVIGNRYVFVARSQWSDFDDDGNAKPVHRPAIIGEIRLAH